MVEVLCFYYIILIFMLELITILNCLIETMEAISNRKPKKKISNLSKTWSLILDHFNLSGLDLNQEIAWILKSAAANKGNNNYDDSLQLNKCRITSVSRPALVSSVWFK